MLLDSICKFMTALSHLCAGQAGSNIEPAGMRMLTDCYQCCNAPDAHANGLQHDEPRQPLRQQENHLNTKRRTDDCKKHCSAIACGSWFYATSRSSKRVFSTMTRFTTVMNLYIRSVHFVSQLKRRTLLEAQLQPCVCKYADRTYR